MKARTLEKMQYFAGKVCSIVSTSMNRSFDEQISREHFVVHIEEITSDGIWGTHPYNNELLSFFAMEHIISIHQEIQLDPSNPEHAQMIKDFEDRTGKTATPDIQGVPKETPPDSEEPEGMTFVDIDNLEALAETTKRTLEAQERSGK
jgi:hypothetical protein